MIKSDDKQHDIFGSQPAMIRAARHAADQTRQHGQPLVFWKDGQVVRVMPDELPELPVATQIKSD